MPISKLHNIAVLLYNKYNILTTIKSVTSTVLSCTRTYNFTNYKKAMTKGHNQSHHKQSGQTPTSSMNKDESRHLKDQQKDKSPDQGRSKNRDQSGGTKGKNAI